MASAALALTRGLGSFSSKIRAVDTESARSGLWTQSQQGQGCGHRVSKIRAVDTESARSGLWTQQGQGCGHRVSKVRAVDTESARSGLWTQSQQGQGCGHSKVKAVDTQQGQGCGHRVSKVRAVDIDTTVMTYCTLCLLHIALSKRGGGERERKTTTTALCLYPGYTVDCLGKKNLDHTECEKQTSAACYNMFHEQSLKHIFFYLVPNNAVPPHF